MVVVEVDHPLITKGSKAQRKMVLASRQCQPRQSCVVLQKDSGTGRSTNVSDIVNTNASPQASGLATPADAVSLTTFNASSIFTQIYCR